MIVIKIVTFIATLLLYTQQFSISTLYIKIGNRRHFEDIANIDDVLKQDWRQKELYRVVCCRVHKGSVGYRHCVHVFTLGYCKWILRNKSSVATFLQSEMLELIKKMFRASPWSNIVTKWQVKPNTVFIISASSCSVKANDDINMYVHVDPTRQLRTKLYLTKSLCERWEISSTNVPHQNGRPGNLSSYIKS